MKIGLNTYSFRRELENKSLTLEKVFAIAKKLQFVEGIELLDRHIPGWPSGDLNAGIKDVKELAAKYNLQIYALGPHVHLYNTEATKVEKEIAGCKQWIDFCAENNIPAMRTQVGGVVGLFGFRTIPKAVVIVRKFLDKVLPYAEEKKVKIGLETHHQFSSHPVFLKQISDIYRNSPALGIIYDWGNFKLNSARYQVLDIATEPHNHIYNHVKIFNFTDTFQEVKYDTMRIVQAFQKANFNGFFSIEFEGKQPSLEGVYKTVNGLKYAITNGQHKIEPNFDYNSLLQ